MSRWAHLIKQQEENKRKKSVPVYKKDMLNLSMHADLARNKVTKTMKDFTPEELKEIEQRLLSNEKFKRQHNQALVRRGALDTSALDQLQEMYKPTEEDITEVLGEEDSEGEGAA